MFTINRRTVLRTALIGGLAATVVACTDGYAYGASHKSNEHVVTIKGHVFEPAVLEIAAGDVVTFVNEDRAPHTATHSDGAFDTGRLGKGDSKALQFSAAGSFSYFCAVHPSMKAEIIVK